MAIMHVHTYYYTVEAGNPTRLVSYLTRTEGNPRRQDVQAVGMQLPEWAKGNPALFFETAKRHERINGQWASMWILTLPHELTHEQNRRLTDAFLTAHLQSHPHLWVMHDNKRKDGQPQPHLHVLWQHRKMDGIARLPSDCFRRYSPRHPERGGWQKERWWSRKRALYALRASWAECVNYALEEAGHIARIAPQKVQARRGAHDPLKNQKAQIEAVRWWNQRRGRYAASSLESFAEASAKQTRREAELYFPKQVRSLARQRIHITAIERQLSTYRTQEGRTRGDGWQTDSLSPGDGGRG